MVMVSCNKFLPGPESGRSCVTKKARSIIERQFKDGCYGKTNTTNKLYTAEGDPLYQTESNYCIFCPNSESNDRRIYFEENIFTPTLSTIPASADASFRRASITGPLSFLIRKRCSAGWDFAKMHRPMARGRPAQWRTEPCCHVNQVLSIYHRRFISCRVRLIRYFRPIFDASKDSKMRGESDSQLGIK